MAAGEITTKANTVYKNFTGGGDVLEPDKAEIRDLFALIDKLVANAGGPNANEKAIVIGLCGDSRAAGSNASIGTAGLSAAATDTYVWNPSTSAWRNASVLGVAPYDLSGTNNPGRAITSIFHEKSGKTVYLVQWGVSGSNIWTWLDPTASHGYGSGANWNTFKAMATSAFASSELTSLGITTFDAIIFSMGANNGASPRADFVTYMNAFISQCRQAGILTGRKADLPILWMEMQRASQNSSLQNQSVRSLRNIIPNFAVIPMDQVDNVGDGVHESSTGIEEMKYAAWRAYRSIEVAYPDETVPLMSSVWPGTGSGGGSATAPWKHPAGFRNQEICLRASAQDCYAVIDPRDYQIGDTIMFTNRSQGGAVLYVQPWKDRQLEYLDRPGYYVTGTYTDTPSVSGGVTGIAINAGECAVYQYIGSDILELKSFTQPRSPYAIFTGDGGADVTLASGDVMTGVVLEDNKGISLSSGVFTTVIPGIYEITLALWVIGTSTTGYIAVQKQVGGAGGWSSIGFGSNGNGSATWTRTLTLTRRVKLGAGDKLRFTAAGGTVVHSRAAGFTSGAIRYLQAA